MIISSPDVDLRPPIGQSEVRSLVWRLMTDGEGMETTTGPDDVTKRVFQYIGTIRHARRIGWVDGEGGRLIVDIHARTASREGVPMSLAGEDGIAARQLVHFWESLLLVRQQGTSPAEGSPAVPPSAVGPP